jgi:hypothetical protein
MDLLHSMQNPVELWRTLVGQCGATVEQEHRAGSEQAIGNAVGLAVGRKHKVPLRQGKLPRQRKTPRVWAGSFSASAKGTKRRVERDQKFQILEVNYSYVNYSITRFFVPERILTRSPSPEAGGLVGFQETKAGRLKERYRPSSSPTSMIHRPSSSCEDAGCRRRR